MIFTQHYLGCLSHASYLIGDETTGRAVVVDPRRDIAVYLEEAEDKGLRIERVLETHLHADFLSGHLELAAAAGAVISFGEEATLDFPTEPVVHGQRLSLGEVTLEIRATPGHTPESICVVVYEHPGDSTPYGVLTGDTLFVGDVGRPDLLASSGSGFDATTLGRLLFHSLREQILSLPDETRIFPAHGAGSSCGKQLSSETSSTVGDQRRSNYALQPMTEEQFVAAVTEGLPTRPHYFSFDAQRNRQEHRLLDETVPPDAMVLGEVLDRVAGGAVPLDTREPSDFAAGHLKGAINVGLHGRFAEWAGDVLGPDRDVVLVGDPATALESRVRLARIGFDRVVGFLADLGQLVLERPDLVGTSSRLTIEQLAELIGLEPSIQLVDVRNPGEAAGGTLPGARVIPLAVLVDALDELDRTAPVVVNCAGGYRSMVAASLLRHAGFSDVSDLIGGYGAWAAAGLPAAKDGSRPEVAVEVTPMAVDDLVSAGALLVDVREAHEWSAGHAPRALLIPMGQVEARLDEVQRVPAAVVVCRSGGRSRTVVQLLNAHGINAVNLSGGMRAWEQAGLPVVTDAGSAGRIV
ncbi:MAG TPA: MBL fold metallo-hydrolase [Acidimicrobiales bacterium]|nr:MBL fold metallo-hydrolase [Acidimicrobiales bacterium]